MGALEKKYSVKEAARIVGFSQSTVRRRFRDDPSVGRLGNKEGRFKRPWFKLSIPESSLMKWWDELTRNVP